MIRCGIILVFTIACVSATAQKSSIDGTWQLISIGRFGKEEAVTTTQLKIFADGRFSLLLKSDDGKLHHTAYGTFEINGSSCKETYVYDNEFGNVGSICWQQLELKNDTLYSICYKKVTVQDNLVDDYPMLHAKLVRIR